MDQDQLRDMLRRIAMIESSGGKNTNHPTINSGLQSGQQAVGLYGLLPNTTREVVQSMRNRGAPVPQELQNIKQLSDDDIRDSMQNNTKLQNYVAGDLMSRLLNRTGGDADKAAYMWNNGTNIDPENIAPEDLDSNQYVSKFRNLKSKLNGI